MISDHQKNIHIQKNGKQCKFIVGPIFSKISPKPPIICTQQLPFLHPRGSGDPQLCCHCVLGKHLLWPVQPCRVFAVALSL